MFAPQPTQVKCPQCQQPITLPVQTIIDVGQHPELKEQLLRGQLNLMSCPSCQATGMLATPLLYHDPGTELLLVLVPMQLGFKMEDQERTIGSLTNALMAQIPPDQRKGYLLQPKTVFSLETLAQEILRGDGITPEMIEAQNRTLRLIEDLVAVLEDEELLTAMAEEHQEEINYEFFLLLTQYATITQQEGNHEKAGRLIQLRDKLSAITGISGADAGAPQPDAMTMEEFIVRLLDMPDRTARTQAVAANRPQLDYEFFQTLTRQIESAQAAGDAEQATRLTNLRSELLEITGELDRAAQEELRKAGTLLLEILQAPDREQAVRERIDQVDEAFLVALAANVSAAEKQNQEEAVNALQEIYTIVMNILEENLPPELRLVNQLIRTETPEERREVLQAHQEVVTPQFKELLNALAQDSEEEQQAEVAQRLRTILEEVNQ